VAVPVGSNDLKIYRCHLLYPLFRHPKNRTQAHHLEICGLRAFQEASTSAMLDRLGPADWQSACREMSRLPALGDPAFWAQPTLDAAALHSKAGTRRL
jgi:hypothetical protein